MNITQATLLIIVSGIVNGSYALPTKYITKWRFENIWLQYAIWTFVILPCLFAFAMEPKIFAIYQATPWHILWLIIISGIFFGIGQVCFAFALSIIGFGLTFIISLGLSTSLGFLLPIVFQHPQQIFTNFGIITILGVSLAVIGLIIANHAGQQRDREKYSMQGNFTGTAHTHSTKKHSLGLILAIITGISSANQNFTFALTYPMQTIATNMGAGKFIASNIIWPGFLLAAFIPYAAYMLYLHIKNNSFTCYKAKGTSKYYIVAIIMSLCWCGPLGLYSKAAQLLGSLGPVLGWPMFMIMIILTSNFWGWRHQEWANATSRTHNIMKISIIMLIVAIIILAIGAMQ